jgi:hypothetical protein
MTHGRLYYLSLYLPNKVKLPFYARSKKWREKICDLILSSIESGEAKLYQAGLDRPDEKVQKSNEEIADLHLFTNVVLKYHSTKKIDLSIDDQALVRSFVNLFRSSEGVMITGDNTRMLVDTDKYRQVILEGRKSWLPTHT